MSTSKLGCAFVMALILFPPTVSDAATIVQGAADDYVWFTAGQYHDLSNPGTSVVVDNSDGTLTTTAQGDESSLVTYQIEFVDAPADYYLYFNFHEITDDSVFVNHGTGFNSVPGKSDDERWNSLDEGWNGLYEIGTGLGDNSNYDVDPGTPEYGWNVAGPSTVSFTVRNREEGVQWKDFVFSQQDDLSVDALDTIIGAPADPYVQFTYTQTTDAAAGTGTISGTIDASVLGGPARLEVSGLMPAATINQKGTTDEPVPDGMVGFIASGSDDGPGADIGVHLGWSGVVTLEGTDGGTTYSIDVPLKVPEDVPYYYEYVLTDDNSSVGGTNDVVGQEDVAGWVGDDGDGHRHTGSDPTWVAGPDYHTTDEDFDVDDDAWGDDLGITVGMRDPDGDPDLFPVFVDEVTFSGTLEPDPATLVPEPGTLALAALGLLSLGGYGWRRRRRV